MKYFSSCLAFAKNDTPRDEDSRESHPKSERQVTQMLFFTLSYKITTEMKLGEGKGLLGLGEGKKR